MEKRSITVSIWTDAWFEELTAHQKLIWLHLLTHTNSNMLGFFDISIKRIASDCSLEKAQVLEALEQFAKDQKAFVYGAKIWLCNFLKHQIMNPNMLKNARSVFDEIPEEIKQSMKNNNLKAFETITEGFGMVTKGFGMVTEPLPNHSLQEKRREELREELREEKKREEDTSLFESVGLFPEEPKKEKQTRFIPPTPDQVQDYFFQYHGSRASFSTNADISRDAEAFHAYYTSNGWKSGANKMKDWEAAARGWVLRSEKSNAFRNEPGKFNSGRAIPVKGIPNIDEITRMIQD